MALTRKRLLLIGFILVLLIGIPATLFVVQQQQELRSRAEKSTTLYFQPESSQGAPIQKNVGDTFTLDVYTNPGTNLVSALRLEITYDPAKLATASAGAGDSSFTPDLTALPNILFGPAYTPGKIAVTMDAGADPLRVINNIRKVGTITFKALAPTNGTVTQVNYGINTLVTSAGDESQFAENVLSAANPAFIAIVGTSPSPPTQPPTGGPTIVVVTGPQGPAGPQGPQGPQGPAGPGGTNPTPVFTIAPGASTAATEFPTDTPTIAVEPPTATPTLAPSGPGDVVVGFGVALTILTILGGILFFAL